MGSIRSNCGDDRRTVVIGTPTVPGASSWRSNCRRMAYSLDLSIPATKPVRLGTVGGAGAVEDDASVVAGSEEGAAVSPLALPVLLSAASSPPPPHAPRTNEMMSRNAARRCTTSVHHGR